MLTSESSDLLYSEFLAIVSNNCGWVIAANMNENNSTLGRAGIQSNWLHQLAFSFPVSWSIRKMTEFHAANSNAFFFVISNSVFVYFTFQRINHRVKFSQSRGIAFLKGSYSYGLQQVFLDLTFAAKTQAHAYWCSMCLGSGVFWLYISSSAAWQNSERRETYQKHCLCFTL